jgi:hypothetical protein
MPFAANVGFEKPYGKKILYPKPESLASESDAELREL